MSATIRDCWKRFLRLRDMRALQLAVAWAVIAATAAAAMSSAGLACLLTGMTPTGQAFEAVLLLGSGYVVSAALFTATVQLLRSQGRKV